MYLSALAGGQIPDVETLLVSNLQTSVDWFPQINPNIVSNEGSEANRFTVKLFDTQSKTKEHFEAQRKINDCSSLYIVRSKLLLAA